MGIDPAQSRNAIFGTQTQDQPAPVQETRVPTEPGWLDQTASIFGFEVAFKWILVFGLPFIVGLGVHQYIYWNGGDRRAEVVGFEVVESMTDPLAIDLLARIRFNEYPTGDHALLTNLQLRFKAGALQEGQVDLNWSEIAARDDCTETVANTAPPLGIECTVRVPVRIISEVSSEHSTELEVLVRWDGDVEHRYRADLKHLYDFSFL